MTAPAGVHGPWMLLRDVRWRFTLLPVRWPFSVRRNSRCHATWPASRFLRSTLRVCPLAEATPARQRGHTHEKRAAGARTVLRPRVRVPPRSQGCVNRKVGVAFTQRVQALRNKLAANKHARGRRSVSVSGQAKLQRRHGHRRRAVAQGGTRTARRGCCPSVRSSSQSGASAGRPRAWTWQTTTLICLFPKRRLLSVLFTAAAHTP